MRRRNRFAILTAAVMLLWGGLAGMLRAQVTNMGGMTMPPNLGQLAGPTRQLMGASRPAQANNFDPGLSITDTFVSFIDSAVPRTAFGLRFDAAYNTRQPMRATYLFAKGGLPNSTGFPLPETRVNTFDLTSSAEFSLT